MQIAISINQKVKSMKKFCVMIFTVFLVAFLSSSFTDTKTALDNDVGYSLTIDQNETVMNFDSPVADMQISRGVSVPDKGLSFEGYNVIIEKQSFQSCRVDNYDHTWQRSTDMNNELIPTKGVNQYSQGVFRLDIGETYLRQNII